MKHPNNPHLRGALKIPTLRTRALSGAPYVLPILAAQSTHETWYPVRSKYGANISGSIRLFDFQLRKLRCHQRLTQAAKLVRKLIFMVLDE